MQCGPNLPTISSTDLSSGSGVWGNLGLAPWTDLENLYQLDGRLVKAGAISYSTATIYLVASGFNFTIPENATITGIEVEILQSSTQGRCVDNCIQLYKLGAVVGDNRANPIHIWPHNQTSMIYGEPNDLWGLSLTPADVNALGFGVAISAFKNRAGPGGAFVDTVRVTVYYT